METIVIFIFIFGYLAITLEHFLKLDKTVPAILMGAICWGLMAFFKLEVFEINTALKSLIPAEIHNVLLHHLGKTSEILIFLLGAMAIVEIIDLYRGFDILKRAFNTKKKQKLLWVFSILGFILSAIIDNLTATIILITLLRKLVSEKKEKLYYIGMIIIAANAGGAWSPMGDITTTMLWISNKVSPVKLLQYVFIPSILAMVVPTFIASFMKIFRGDLKTEPQEKLLKNEKKSTIMLYLGLAMILFVPIFKSITHLPPYMGMLFSLAIIWLAAEYLPSKGPKLSINKALSKIELSSILFFLGILLSVAALESLGKLFEFASWTNHKIESKKIVVLILGFLSAIIDNVPLVAASLGMFSEKLDDILWHFIAYCAGTGGSMLIIGSAAGVAAMGMEKIDFFWYLKKISFLALIGYLAGYISFFLMDFLR